MRRLTFAFVAPLALAACIEESPLAHQGMPRGTLTSTSQTNPLPSAPASTAAPAPTPSGNASETARPAGAVFDGALQVVGYRVDPPQASPGQTVTVSVFLRAVQPLTVDDMMFVHVDDAEGNGRAIAGDERVGLAVGLDPGDFDALEEAIGDAEEEARNTVAPDDGAHGGADFAAAIGRR